MRRTSRPSAWRATSRHFSAARPRRTVPARPAPSFEPPRNRRVRELGAKRPRITILASVIVRHDAISMAARDTARAVREAGFEVGIFTLRSDFPELGAHQVRDAAALRGHRAF